MISVAVIVPDCLRKGTTLTIAEFFAFVTGDEKALYREHGLLPEADAS